MDKTCSTRTRPRPRPTSRSWYVCSFCRRDFSSAQALGGHMNVHRRDRARLLLQYSPPSSSSRLSPPSDSSHDSTDVVDDHHHETSVLLMPPSHKLKQQLAEEHQEEQLEKVVRLELGMGMGYYCKQQQLQDPLMAASPKPTLDLELRLGCSFTSI